MAKKLALKSFRLKNFKAIRDSGVVKFTPLTVLIGDNGSGKSSLVEGLQTYQRIVSSRLDLAMNRWNGFEHIVNPPIDRTSDDFEKVSTINPIEFIIRGEDNLGAFRTQMSVEMSPQSNDVIIDKESLQLGGRQVLKRNRKGELYTSNREKAITGVPTNASIIAPWLMVMNTQGEDGVDEAPEIVLEHLTGFDWQFLTLVPNAMGESQQLERSGRNIRLRSDGSNVAEFLWDIRRLDSIAYDGIFEALQYVLPYADDLRLVLTDVLGRRIHVEVLEKEFKIPGWLLSTGTLRVLALLALFRHPEPPSVIIIEEIENGLDPRTMHLIVEEIRNLVESGRSQVIVTTHSPYLLDLLPLWSIVLVERDEKKGPVFSRPHDNPALEKWSEQFGAGQLYTMQRLGNGSST